LTYDYDGKFILIAPVKLDKLPLLTTSVNHAVTRAESKDNTNKQPVVTSNTDKTSLNSEKLATVISDKQRSTNSTNMNGNEEDTKAKKQKENEKLLQQQ